MHKSKKGFTIVELVIVIAVIAILAAVLIPTFSNLVKKANQSADIQAARQMNTVLAAEGAAKKVNVFEVYDALAANGMTAKDYRPLTTDHYFFWDDGANRIVYTDKNYQILFPTDFEKQGNWISLTQKIAATKPANFSVDAPVTVKTGAELLYVVSAAAEAGADKEVVVNIPVDGIDMMGAAFEAKLLTASLTIKSADDTKPAKIYNATAIDAAYMGKGNSKSDMGQYNTALFPKVNAGETLKIENVVFENINVKNTNTSNISILVGEVSGNVVINNVTIKNSTVIGHRNVGALIGNIQASGNATIGKVTMENVQVQTVGGRSGMLIGVMGKTNNEYGTLLVNGPISLTNCAYGIYKCEQNTGTFDGKALGLQSTNLINSYAFELNETTKKFENKFKDYFFDANALATKEGSGDGETWNDLFNGKVTGW